MLEIQIFLQKNLQTADVVSGFFFFLKNSEWLLVNDKVILIVGLDENQ